MLLSPIVRMFSLAVMVLVAGSACGQDYPSKPIRLVTGLAGGGGDFVARIVAQGISGSLGQPIVVDNRVARLTGEIVAKAPADGYTLLVAGAAFAFAPLLEKMPYDPLTDFSPISILESSPNVLVVPFSVAANSVKELIALAKAKPGVLNYASPSVGSSAHLAAELFKSMAGINIVHVPYKGGSAAIIGLLGGEAQLTFSVQGVVSPHLKAGRLKALGITGAEPSALFPGVPTVAASGVPGYQFGSIDFILAPAKTPAPVISRLNREVVRLLNQADVKEKYLNSGIEARSSTPEELGARMKSDNAKVSKLIKDAGIRVD